MAFIRLTGFPAKTSPVPADIVYIGDSANSDTESKSTIQQIIDGAGVLKLAGGTMSGTLTLNTSSPSGALEAASKGYVDMLALGLNVVGACTCATTTALNATYSNGSSGVGATLTNAGSLAAFTVDGITPTLGQRILVKNQASTFQNGIYTITTLGTGAVAWVLTRATDYDTAAEITPGDFVLINTGSAQAATAWIQTATVVTMGTSPILFSLFGAAFPVSISNGGTGVAAVTTSPTATMWAGWDANKNLSSNSFLSGYTTTATGGTTTTLAVGSTEQQFFTGSTTQTVVLPVTSTLALGQSFYIANNSTGVVTVQSSGANTVQAMAANSTAIFTCILTSGTSAASWNVAYTLPGVTTTTALKKGTNGGNYTTAGTSFVDVDGTNLSYTVTIPVGYKLTVNTQMCVTINNPSDSILVQLVDGATVLQLSQFGVGSTTLITPMGLCSEVDGDGSSHTLKLQFKTGAGLGTAVVINSSSVIPTMVFQLMPSN